MYIAYHFVIQVLWDYSNSSAMIIASILFTLFYFFNIPILWHSLELTVINCLFKKKSQKKTWLFLENLQMLAYS